MNSSHCGVKISVAMATYNGEKYIREQLETLAEQTLLPDELIVTDDGSSDRTIEILNEFCKDAPFTVRIHQNPQRLGFAENFLHAARLCQGNIIAFCDQDDKWHPDKLNICATEFEDAAVVMCVHSSVVWTGKRDFNRRYPGFDFRTVVLPNTTDPVLGYPGFSLLFRRYLINIFDISQRPRHLHTLGTRNLLMTHDEFVCFLAASLGKCVHLPDNLALYRQHDQNVCGAGKDRNFFERLQLSMKNLNYYELSRLSNECALFMESITEAAHESFRESARTAAARFRYRARLQGIRAKLFDDSTKMFERAKSFGDILILGGYFPDHPGSRLGPRAALKDFLFGLPGLYKIRALEEDA